MHGQTWPATATSQASYLASDWRLFAVCGAAVTLLVGGLIVFAAVRFRRRDGDPIPPQFRRNDPLEIAWTLAPLVLVGGLFVHALRVETAVDALDPHPDIAVAVDGFRWGWRFTYDGGPTIWGDQTHPPQLVIPQGRIVRISLTSSDVNHAFWVPDFLFKRDAIPGQVNRFDLRPEKVGTYLGRCAEFCGIGHAFMSFSVRVVPPQAFAAWRRGAQPR